MSAPRRLAGWVLPALLLCAAARAQEPPPTQGTQLQFQKTLFVQQVDGGKVFAESRQVERGDSLWRLLTEEYGISGDTAPAFIAAFRQVNPGVDPDRLQPGDVVRVPFKVERQFAAPPPDEPEVVHEVRPGESLWRILTRRFGVPREAMGAALRKVAAANPHLQDLDRLLVGQRLAIPAEIAGAAGRPDAGSGPLPPHRRTVLSLLTEMGCSLADTGETFLPLERGRTLRLDAAEFPLLTGPGGAKVVLDPRSRLTPPLVAAVEGTWGYPVVQGVAPDAEAELARLLPLLGFQEVTEGQRTVAGGAGGVILALPRWTVLPRTEDLWEGRLHLLFPAGSELDPVLVEAVRRAGYQVHRLGGGSEPAAPPAAAPSVLRMDDPARGAGELLGLLGIPHRVHPEVECRLAGGVSYRLRPLLTFRHLGLDYAVPPETPAAAEALLSRAGYVTVPWVRGASPLNLLGDLLALVGVPHARVAVEVPEGGGLRLQVTGITLDAPEVAAVLYPAPAGAAEPRRLLLTEARLFEGAAPLLAARGLLPWVVVTR